MKTIVCISGTSRPENFTSKALAVVVDELTREGVHLELFDARELNLTFPGHGMTEDAFQMKEAIQDAAGVVLATPEYHGGFAAMTKLILENLGFPSALGGKPLALLGVAAGRIGAIKSLEQLRAVCAHTGALVLPGAVSIAGVQQAFDGEGRCVDEDVENALRGVAHALLDFLEEYVCPKHTLEAMVREDGPSWTASV